MEEGLSAAGPARDPAVDRSVIRYQRGP